MLAEKLQAQGVVMAVDGDELTVETVAPLTDEQRKFIRAHKTELMAELKALSDPECHMWSYLLDPDLLQYTRMGLMTNDIEEARRQLLEIYGKPVTMLHLRQESKEITTKTEEGRILITTADGSYLWKLGEGCDFIEKGQDDFRPFPDLETARAWVKKHIGGGNE